MSSPQNSTRFTEPVFNVVGAPFPPRANFSGDTIPALHSYYTALLAAYGPQHWWPARTRFEIIVGAVLTQNTSWSNVTLALENLRRERLLKVSAIAGVSSTRLARLI